MVVKMDVPNFLNYFYIYYKTMFISHVAPVCQAVRLETARASGMGAGSPAFCATTDDGELIGKERRGWRAH